MGSVIICKGIWLAYFEHKVPSVSCMHILCLVLHAYPLLVLCAYYCLHGAVCIECCMRFVLPIGAVCRFWVGATSLFGAVCSPLVPYAYSS